jgi:Tol biopolymer transport system component
MTLDAGERFSNTGRQTIAVAPDGRMIAWTSNSRLIVQSLESRTPRPLTDYSAVAVINPVFSPDGQSIVFQSGGVLRRVSVRGGTAAVLTPPLNGTVFGLNWMPDGIYYGELKTSDLSGPTRIQRLSPSDGTLTTIAESLPGETFFAPSSLPKNRGTLVTLAKGNSATRWEQSQLIVILPSGERRTVLTGAADGRYLPTGQLAYSAGGVVFAAPFDLDTLAVSGAAAPILEGVARGYPTTGATQYAFSASGTLVYLPGPASLVETGRTLAAFSMDGSFARLATRPDRYEFARVSPDGAFLAVGANSDAGADIWIVDLSGKSDRRRVTQEGRNRFPVWSPDSRRIAFQSTRQDGHGIYWQAADGSGRAERLTTAEAGVEHVPMAWAPDKTLVFEVVKSPRWSLWTLSLPSGTTRQLIPDDSASPMTPVFSPDGKWLAYHTQAFTASSRRDTVWIRRFPIDENRWEVSSEGSSHHPLWINSGRQLLYIVGAGQWIVRDLISGATPSFAPARSLPSLIAPTAPSTVETRTFDLLSDGRIAADTGNAVVAAGSVAAITQTIEVVEHWFEELKARVPTK